MSVPLDPFEVSCRLLAWYGQKGRDLPWRQSRDPYRIWLSEIMLQQTTVAAVIPYYERFLQRLPTLAALASASLDEIITLWAGLGYYSRARNLHLTAKRVVEERGGAFPDTLEELIALPGIGRSTAGAIMAIAFDRPAPILDGNVRRVLVRLFAWMDDPRSSRAEKQLWAWAELLTSVERPHDYAQAIMDLGATICTPRAPQCSLCPLQASCLACKSGLAEDLPIPRKKQQTPVRQQVALILVAAGKVLVRKRWSEGFLGGLWEFPGFDLSSGQGAEQAALRLLDDLALPGVPEKVGEVRHAYSHFKLELTLFAAAVDSTAIVAEKGSHCWCSAAEMETLPLHGAHRKAFHLWQSRQKLSES